MFKFKASPASEFVIQKPVFTPSEYSLDAAPVEQNQTRYLLNAAELTLVFDQNKKCLIGFDSYTNSAAWVPASIELPKATFAAVVILETPMVDDRDSYEIVPEYFYDESNSTLKIQVEKQPASQYYLIAEKTYLGMTASGELSDLIIEGLKTM